MVGFKIQHLEENNIGYFSHMKRALKLSIYSLKASICFLIHSIYPDILVDNGSNIINELSTELSTEIKELKN